MTDFMSVVLPAPLRPIRPIIAPLGTSSETSRKICIAAIETLRFSILSTHTYDVALDLRIIARTLALVLTGQGLYKGETGGWGR